MAAEKYSGSQKKGLGIQQNIKRQDKDFSEYGLFLTGIDVSTKNIDQFDPLRGGFARIFIVRLPRFMVLMDQDRAKRFKHLIEFGFTRVDGIGDATLETEDITGGYTGNKFAVPSITRDQIDEFTISCYEFSGSPIREFIDTWMTGISDPLTGISHYHGMISADCQFKASNHVMELIYVVTDPTGWNIEYSCMISNMMPKSVKKGHFNYESGSHPAVSLDLNFTASKYESPQINEVAAALMNKYRILQDYLNFHSGWVTNATNGISSNLNSSKANSVWDYKKNSGGNVQVPGANSYAYEVTDVRTPKKTGQSTQGTNAANAAITSSNSL